MTIPTPEQIKAAIEFLRGTKPFDGAWFGDPHPENKYKFWWRNRGVLPTIDQALTAKDARIKELEEALLFYANGRHMSEHGVDEPPEWVMWDCENGGAIETGAVAQAALAAKE